MSVESRWPFLCKPLVLLVVADSQGCSSTYLHFTLAHSVGKVLVVERDGNVTAFVFGSHIVQRTPSKGSQDPVKRFVAILSCAKNEAPSASRMAAQIGCRIATRKRNTKKPRTTGR